MKFFTLVLVIIATAQAVPLAQPADVVKVLQDYGRARIVDGHFAKAGQFPWQVLVHGYTPSEVVCGGSLINPGWILTAAHCVSGSSQFTVYLGSIDREAATEDGRVEEAVNNTVIHPNYDEEDMSSDLALLQLPKPVDLNDRIEIIRLPQRKETLKANTIVTASGWGRTDDDSELSPVLMYANLKTISNKKCKDILDTNKIVATTVCAVGNPHHSICAGDDGGPLISYDSNRVPTLVGVASFVSETSGCESGDPSAYVRTEKFIPWIEEATGVQF